jgi:hypothetical protein
MTSFSGSARYSAMAAAAATDAHQRGSRIL